MTGAGFLMYVTEPYPRLTILRKAMRCPVVTVGLLTTPKRPIQKKKTKKDSLALAHKAPFNRALVFIGAMLPRAQRAARNSGAVHLDVAPSATAAILRV